MVKKKKKRRKRRKKEGLLMKTKQKRIKVRGSGLHLQQLCYSRSFL
jgi:hypothetical protein